MNLCNTGAIKTPAVAKNTIPEYNAYNEANSLPAAVWSWFTGPIPPRIIEALSKESIHGKRSSAWYPTTPMPNEPHTMPAAIPTDVAKRETNALRGMSFSVLCSNNFHPPSQMAATSAFWSASRFHVSPLTIGWGLPFCIEGQPHRTQDFVFGTFSYPFGRLRHMLCESTSMTPYVPGSVQVSGLSATPKQE